MISQVVLKININQVRFKTLMLRSSLCDYADAYIVIKGDVTVADLNNNAFDKK